ncbi:MAG: 2-oxo acid dehydrogenase subunit E2 [Oscillospiraceae bacterium]|nr:2-oxo acid dehydrogenase subunit E2 [Oscillospiraceae bacterium]
MEDIKKRRRFGDRKDGVLLRDLDPMHFIVPLLYPNRCDNEAFISERIDLTNANIYLEKRNREQPEYVYNLFQLIVTAALKTITLRPKMNRFVANKNLYQRNDVSAAFVIKKYFNDQGAEGLAFLHAEDSDTLDSVHEKIRRQIYTYRNEGEDDSSTKSMDLFNKMPRFLSKFLVAIIRFLDRHGWVPKSLIATDPYYSSVVLTNLGSIQLHSGYHHLTNWGTNSLFIIVGEKKPRPFYDAEGNVTMKDSVDLGLTVDERIADGYYYSKTVRLLKKLLECPELLETPLSEEVEY